MKIPWNLSNNKLNLILKKLNKVLQEEVLLNKREAKIVLVNN